VTRINTELAAGSRAAIAVGLATTPAVTLRHRAVTARHIKMVASVSQSSDSRAAARVLVVEDDPDIAELITLYLEKAGHTVERLEAGDAVMPRVRAGGVDLVILDVMLPGLDGFAVCRLMRADPSTAAIPVIMLTARAEEADRIGGLELGADDYVTKPFSPKELVARVAARLRRTSPAGAALTYGPIVIDVARHVVTDDGTPVKLTAKEFLLLQYLVQHRGRVLSRDLLLTDVWGYQYTGGTRTVDVHIRRLREKLPVLNDGIETVKQFGYKLV
jgi:two-component system, OmpR family, alkaline phosphatase synthesis response regulator PhoP